jgi:hypothetical protein
MSKDLGLRGLREKDAILGLFLLEALPLLFIHLGLEILILILTCFSLR